MCKVRLTELSAWLDQLASGCEWAVDMKRANEPGVYMQIALLVPLPNTKE